MFEDQYHPKVLDIFGTGGDVIHKVNNADEIVDEAENEDGSSIADNNGPSHILYTTTKDMHDGTPLSNVKGMADVHAKALSKRSIDLES